MYFLLHIMGDLFNILMHSLGSIFLGVFIAVMGVALMFFIIHSWWRNSNFTLLSFLVAFILFCLLSFQTVLICGAMTIKAYGENVEHSVNELVSQMPSDIQLSSDNAQAILNQVSNEFPIIGYYVNRVESFGNTPSIIAKSLVDALHRYLNWFILRRIGWCLLFIVCGAVAVINTISIKNRSGESLKYTSRRFTSKRKSRHWVSRAKSR